jgi:hypothetical protein
MKCTWNRGPESDNNINMKIKKRNVTFALLGALVLSAAVAQSQGAAVYPQRAEKGSGTETAIVPSPSSLKASVRENLVILTWTDSPEFKGRYVVFRYDTAIDADNLLSAARLGDIASGSQTYTDTPPDSKPYFYAVFPLAKDGTPYRVFTPRGNTTSIGISVGQTVASAASPLTINAVKPTSTISVQATPPSPSQAFISAIEAKAKGDAIVLSYKVSPKSRLVLYRGTAPIVGVADLLDATLVTAFTDIDGSFADYPVPGVEYYYAILGEEDLKAGRINITAGVNSLTRPAHVRVAAVSAGFAETPPASRTPPLPYFLMENETSSDSTELSQDLGSPPARPLSSETEKAIATLLAKFPQVALAMPATSILPEELSVPSGGEDYALSLIVTDRIAAKDWAGAVDQLRKYLSLNRGPRASARARFYLGEAMAFTGSSRDAFFEFLSAREFYPIETKPWIEYVLSILRKG